MNHDSYDDTYLRGILSSVKTVAMIGASPRPDRPSHGVMAYLQSKGFRVFPVNPVAAGETVLGERCHAALSDVPMPIDMVDVFRNSPEAPGIVAEAIRVAAQVVWLQIGVRNDEAAAMAEAAGLKVVMNRCPKIEYPRLIDRI